MTLKKQACHNFLYLFVGFNIPQDTFHTLVKCPLAKDVWKLSDLGDLSEVVDSFRDWWKLVVQRQNMEELNMTTMLLLSLWNSRNELIWNGRRKSSSWTFNAAIHTLIQWQHARLHPIPQGLNRAISSPVRWTKPASSWVKCNIDAAVFNQIQCIGIGCVVRDENGAMVIARNERIRGMLDPAIAEVMSCREALSWLKSLGLNRVILKSDAQLVIQSILNLKVDVSYFGALINDC